MSNFLQAQNTFTNAINGNSAFVVLNTSERLRAEALLRNAAAKTKREIWLYSDVKQFYKLGSNDTADAKRLPLMFLETQLKKSDGRIFCLFDLNYINTDTAVSRQLVDLVYLAYEHKCTIVLCGAGEVANELKGLATHINLSLPDEQERREIICEFVSSHNKNRMLNLSDSDITEGAALLAGLNDMQIKTLLASTLASANGLNRASLESATRLKDQVYGTIPSVSKISTLSAQAAGLDNLKKWLKNKRDVFFHDPDALKARCLTPPKGVLLAGVSGCGKSLSAKLIATEWGLPLFRFDIGSVFNKYVGESERNMKEALKYIDNVSPCVLWVDEIEKSMPVSGSTDDTARRILGEFLFWLQESKSRVFLVATANDVTKLPRELFRKGRFSEVFFIDLPNERERKSAIELYCNSSLHYIPNDKVLSELVDLTQGFSYADIETAIKDSAEIALTKGQAAITDELIKSKIKATACISSFGTDDIERLRQWGKGVINASAKE